MAGEERSNYAKMRDAMADVFLQYDQSAMIRKFGLEHDAAYLYVVFVNRRYRIDRRSGKVSWSGDGFRTQEDADYNAAMTIYDVLCCSKADCCLAHEWVSVGSLSGIRGGTLGKGSNFFQDAGKLFSGQTQALARACEALGGKRLERGGRGLFPGAFSLSPGFPALLGQGRGIPRQPAASGGPEHPGLHAL